MTVMEPMIDDPDLLNSCLLLMLLFRLITRGGDRKRRKAIMPTTYRWENNRVPIRFQTGVFCESDYVSSRIKLLSKVLHKIYIDFNVNFMQDF